MQNKSTLDRADHDQANARFVALTDGSVVSIGEDGRRMAANFLHNSIVQNPENQKELDCANQRLSMLREGGGYAGFVEEEKLRGLKDVFTHNFSLNLMDQEPSRKIARQAVEAYREVGDKDESLYHRLEVLHSYHEMRAPRVQISKEESSIADEVLKEKT